ncbi:MAG: 50S ribosomal protein L3 [Candidatus Caldatribacteriota bacterium]
MSIGIIGEKVGMTRVFNKEGQSIPVTVIQAGPCPVVQVKNQENDGYTAVQIGFKDIKKKKVTQPLVGHFAKKKLPPLKYLKEFRIINPDEFNSTSEIKVDIFKDGERVDITGISKGKGFASAFKKHNFSGGPKTHGQKDYYRAVGSIGATDAARVFKGKRMPGHTGNHKVKIKNLEVIKVDVEKNLILIKGAVPGAKGTILLINKIT